MKLIEKGTNLDKKYRATCRCCGSVFESKKSELVISFDRNEICIQSETCTECGSYGLNFEEYNDPTTEETFYPSRWRNF
jgi:hypothetical protein